MVYVNNFMISLKSSWIQKLLKGEQSWIHIFYAICKDTVILKLLYSGDNFIKKLEGLKSKLYVVPSNITNNLQSTYKGTSLPVWYSSKISVGKKGM